ncbi:hypothetical protein F5B20DRAFT_565669 [Whalleya microplaca]|nr:hypothetical protein F5B20DRAFT_565669 [Whalleya microplaca]
MTGLHVLKSVMSRPRRGLPFSLRGNPHLDIVPRLSPSLDPSRLAKAPLPTAALFNGTLGNTVSYPIVSVFRASPTEQYLNARFLLFRRPSETPPQVTPPQATPPQATPPQNSLSPRPRYYIDPEAQVFSRRMLNWIQIITTPTADSNGTCFLLHFDDKRYLFGNLAEGVQRAVTQRKIGLNKVEDVFLSGLVNWQQAGGLFGLLLTVADMHASAKEDIRAANEEHKKKGRKQRPDDTLRKLSIHGGKNLTHLLATARRFIFRKGMPLEPHEIRNDPRLAEQHASQPDWQDTNINVWYMPVQSARPTPTSPRKRTHDEYTEDTGPDTEASLPPTSSASEIEKDMQLVETVVTQMFDSDWKMDALVETTLHQVKLPAKLFVRDHKGHLELYDGPLPGNGDEVPDIPVLVRQPWPGAMVPSLPRTNHSNQSMCYIVKGHERRGKFNPEAAERFGIPKFDYKLLTSGQNVVGKDGVVVTPDMVLGESVPGTGFAIVDLPDSSYIEALVNRTEWSNSNIMKGILVIFWNLGRDVVNDSRLQDFMRKLSSIQHIVTSEDSCPNMISLESVTAQAYKLRCVDPDRFPLPIYDNEHSLADTSLTGTPSGYERGRTGKMIQFAPHFLNEDDKIVPFPNIETLARGGLSKQVLRMAEQARKKTSDPEFLAKVEKVESDIPHRDAEIITLGTGSAQPSKYRNVSATLLRVPGYGNYLFDCGESTLGQMRRTFGKELPDVLRNLKGIWISHLHADHHLGTASVIKTWHEETRASQPTAKLLVASHTHMIQWLREYADVEEFGFDRLTTVKFQQQADARKSLQPHVFTTGETAVFGLRSIDACLVNHCFGALATVFTFASGLRVAYSGDCRPSPLFASIGRGAHLLIHESTFDDELRGDAVAKKHSTMSEAIEVGRRMGARRILLTHFSQRYQQVPLFEEHLDIRAVAAAVEGSDASTEEKAKVDEVVLVAFDYMRVKLGDFRKAQAFLPAVQKLFENWVD